MNLFFYPCSKLRIQCTDLFWLWISWGHRAEVQFTISGFWWKPFIQWTKKRSIKRIEFGPFSFTKFY